MMNPNNNNIRISLALHFEQEVRHRSNRDIVDERRSLRKVN